MARPDDGLPPSVLAAKRDQRGYRHRHAGSKRAYPAVDVPDDAEAAAVELAATRALLEVTSPTEAAEVVATLVHDLGGGLVPARLAESASVPIDVSLGLSEPLLPWAEPVSVAELRLGSVLPEFVDAARRVVSRLQGDTRRFDELEHDALTGLLTRRAWMRRLGSARAGDAVALIDLDNFKSVNDSSGHAAGDEVLRSLGALLVRTFRGEDACGRYGGDEITCLSPGMPVHRLVERLDHMRHEWEQSRSDARTSVGLSIGVAAVTGYGPRAALTAADRALYRAKGDGRNETAVATQADYDGLPAT
jgi:diguanylate cyclase (GGDEF)-like protein